jgi:hypothetical protein
MAPEALRYRPLSDPHHGAVRIEDHMDAGLVNLIEVIPSEAIPIAPKVSAPAPCTPKQ